MGTHKMAKLAKGLSDMLLALALLAVPACTVKQGGGQEYVVIGAIFPRGSVSYYEAISAVNGIHVAREEINHNGGILGKNLDVLVLLANDQQQADALQQYTILKAKGVAAIMVLAASDIAATLKQIAEKDGMPLVDLNLLASGAATGRTNSDLPPLPSITRQGKNNGTFVNKYTSMFHYEPTITAAVAYEIILMLCEAIKKSEGTNKEEIVSAINAIQFGE
jgi:ABC-type branched-subunit amino acid transport system substrate-binding protein